MPAEPIRILSDLHYGDRASSLTRLEQLHPLFEGATRIVLNGDTLDTRPGADPRATLGLWAAVSEFFSRAASPVTLLTGNHDPDISAQHHIDFGPAVLITHGDALFDDLVPWSQDAPLARRLVAEELAALPPGEREQLHARLGAFRRAAAAIPQRHQSEPHGLKYLIGFLQDTVWPPTRVLRVLRAWHVTPQLAETFVAHHRPKARFLAMGHTHRLGVRRTARGLTVLNTGSFCPPCHPGVIELTSDRLVLRRVERHRSDYHLGRTLAEFPLAQS
ncbi:metallophosphoesterase family protein [Opitutus terrae]|uniref:Metallophosphoesterase n=1 Tax=Opitutus terrae (strain DSM 11246 / JCM 15787 / PB90-1) TaxID=452637 RepID=B1ZS61_OPITP|nr:metallophosphoesterase family protein [Opitutus terrae]ACB75660.1 metallophosphoesterase [Opitutus terrae PB90-1]